MTPNIGAKLWCSVVFLLLKPHYFKLAASTNTTQCSHITKYVVTQKMKQELNIKILSFQAKYMHAKMASFKREQYKSKNCMYYK